MRDYLSISNLRKSLVLGSAVTAAATPRILQGSDNAEILIPSAMLLMTLVAGAVLAWGARGGMVGAFPDRRVMLAGLAGALLVGLVAGMLRMIWSDQALRDVLVSPDLVARFELSFPGTVAEKLALVLWAAGFQVLFFQAGVMAFASRLTGRWEYALVLAGFFRIWVMHLQMDQAGVPPVLSAYIMSTATTLIGATLFARSGLPAAMVFAAAIELRLLWL